MIKNNDIYKQDLIDIANELIEKMTRLFNEYVRSSINKKDQVNNFHTLIHIIYLICSKEKYFDNDYLRFLDYCTDDLLFVYQHCKDKRISYKKEYEKYKQSEHYTLLQNMTKNQ